MKEVCIRRSIRTVEQKGELQAKSHQKGSGNNGLYQRVADRLLYVQRPH